MKITIGSETFPTIKAAEDRCRAMLDGAPLDETFLRGLLALHRKAVLKIGCGVRRFYVGSDGWGGRCFWIERVDGSITDFSYRACITPPSKKTEVMQALRDAIRPQIDAFLDRTFIGSGPVACAITGCAVWRGQHHVDHCPPRTFDAIAAAFLTESMLILDDIEVSPEADGNTIISLVDQDLSQRWQVFHASRAMLRITTPAANVRQGRGR